ncbi:MAG: hypothetical protein J6N15_09150 [Ruminiclostridium sp.]|nr:hypothetical protein [Ruminiclostridium sp.]
MADAKQDNKKKEPNSEGLGFKRVMGGFDINEVNLYISKLRKQMKEQSEEYEKRISNLQTNLEDANREAAKAKSDKKTAEQAAATASAPIIKDSSEETKKLIEQLKKESDAKIMELRKSVLDERRNVAKFDKDCAKAQMSEKKIREEYEKLKEKYLNLKRNGGGAPQGKAVTTSNADEVMAEIKSYANDIISAAKSYASEAVNAANKYKADVEAELKERSDKINEVKKKLEDQIRKTESEQAESASKVKEATEKIGNLTSLFDAFAKQFSSVNSQISGVTENIDNICKQFDDTTKQIGTVAQQITDTTGQINDVSRQINETTSQISGFAKTISETTDKINDASKQMNAATDMISEASKAMTETSGMITDASKQMSGFGEQLNSAKSGVSDITKLVDAANSGLDSAKTSVDSAAEAAGVQTSAADLSPFGKIGAELSDSFGKLRAKLSMPVFDDSRFSNAKLDAITKKLKFETTYEQSESAPIEEDDEFGDSDILSSLEIDSPDQSIPSDDDLMADMPDVITSPVFEESSQPVEKTAPKAAPKPAPKPAEDKSSKTERPGLDADFEDFFLTEPKDDDMSGDMPLINMEGVGVVDDFSLDPIPEPSGADFEIAPIDTTAKPEKGADLGADIFDIAIDPDGADDDTLARMMDEANAAEKAANKDLTPTDLNFDEENTLPSSSSDDFGEFADLFAQGSTQTATDTSKSKPAFRKPKNDDPWSSFASDSDSDGGTSSDPSTDSDLSDFFV